MDIKTILKAVFHTFGKLKRDVEDTSQVTLAETHAPLGGVAVEMCRRLSSLNTQQQKVPEKKGAQKNEKNACELGVLLQV